MLTESDRRAAALAVSRYGVERARIKQLCVTLLQSQKHGGDNDLLEMLVGHNLLTAAQASELRLSLDVTHLDPTAPGRTSAAGNDVPTEPDALDAVDVVTVGSVFELNNLGEFRILRPLGEGGMGSVYLGYHEGQDRHVAIKVLPDHLASDQAYVDRFYREARSGALLDHPNIVHSIAVSQDQASGKHYLVLEYVEGPSAHALLQQFGKLPVGDAVHIALEVAHGLEHAHSRNIVHRDIKPDNILLTPSGVAKLSDLGLSRRTDEASHLTAARQGFGTPYYMPYEQAMNARSADGRSDIFALGGTLYHLVTGEVPFPGKNHLEVMDKKDRGEFTPASVHNPAVPPVLDRILNKMLARDPADRYQTASELIVDLERSSLAAAVPSFVDPELALQDPLVRARLTSPPPPTRPDLEAPVHAATRDGNPDVWYLRYRNGDGRLCKTRATTEQVLRRLREGRIPATVEASHSPQGVFRNLDAYPEFEALDTPLVRPKRADSRRGRKADPERAQDSVGGNAVALLPVRFAWVMASGIGILAAGASMLYLVLRD